MRAGLLRGAGARSAGAAAVLCGVALFFGGGSSYGPLAAIGSVAIVAASLALALAFWGRLPLPRFDLAGWVCVGCLAAFVVWMGLSISWSVAPDNSWEYF